MRTIDVVKRLFKRMRQQVDMANHKFRLIVGDEALAVTFNPRCLPAYKKSKTKEEWAKVTACAQRTVRKPLTLLSFPRACPEPVLANRRVSCKTKRESAVFHCLSHACLQAGAGMGFMSTRQWSKGEQIWDFYGWHGAKPRPFCNAVFS